MKRTCIRMMTTLIIVTLLATPGTGETTPDISVLKQTSKAFASVAKHATPAVVFVTVEKSIVAGIQPYAYNDPFEFFGDDFIHRFFRQSPRFQQQPRQFIQKGAGSGFLISKDGYILTNNHVVGDADSIKVTLSDGREFDARRIGSDPKSEVAVIKIDADDLPFLELGDSSEINIGEWVIAIGNPFGLTETVTVGVISAKGRSLENRIADYEDFIQTDAAINPGNSGGPLLNIEGKAIGINTAIYSQSGGYMGIGFAIPINMAKDIKDQLIKTGKVVRGYLGVYPQEVTKDLAEYFGMNQPAGIVIAEVVKDSPADTAGLKARDIVLELNGKKVTDPSSFRNMVSSNPPGTNLKLQILRDGKKTALTVKTGTLPDETTSSSSTVSGTEESLGMKLQDITPELSEKLGYEVESGVLVTEVTPGGPADRARIRAGMVISGVNDKKIKNINEFADTLSAFEKSKRLLLVVRNRNYSWLVVLNK
ncbi:MAG: DegQ family serine endoprotease [Lentisphaerae bacterium]|nr:DegQ family serine endoprotease [Lentisphaerota bacterium]